MVLHGCVGGWKGGGPCGYKDVWAGGGGRLGGAPLACVPTNTLQAGKAEAPTLPKLSNSTTEVKVVKATLELVIT